MKNKPNVLLAFTSLTQPKFEKLLVAFEQAWDQYIMKEFITDQERQHQYGGGRKPTLKTAADRLLFILFPLKRTLRRYQRPKNNQKQREYYSSKKKVHTVKNNLIAHPESRKVCYLSDTIPGKKHDKKLADEANMTLPRNCLLEQDIGYQGISPERVIILQPKKKPKGKDLTLGEKFINKVIASARIVVEDVIAGVKWCRIVKDVFRNRKEEFADLVINLACGLHNFRVEHRSPLQTVNLVDFYFR